LKKVILKNIKHPQQLNPDGTYNGDDCGVYVIAIAEFLVRRYQNNSSVMN
jgi:Ulp1 family protease